MYVLNDSKKVLGKCYKRDSSFSLADGGGYMLSVEDNGGGLEHVKAGLQDKQAMQGIGSMHGLRMICEVG